MTTPAILTEGLAKRYGETLALDGLDLTVDPCRILALLGPNGAGKTTTVRILATLLPPDAGHALVAGFDVARRPEEVRARIGLTGQYAALDDYLSGRRNLEMVGRLYHLPARVARQRADELLAELELTEAADRPVKTWSGGMRRRLDLAASLIVTPPVIFLDEPTTGLDPRGRQTIWERVSAVVAEGTTVLLTAQYLDEADQFADEIVILNRGRTIAAGTAAELKARVGGERLEVRLASGDLAAAAGILEQVGDGAVSIDAPRRRLSVPLARGSARLTEIVRRLDEAGIEPADIALRQITLDDVFLTLTGHAASPNGDELEEEAA